MAVRKIARGSCIPALYPGVESGWNVWLGEGIPPIKPLGPNLSYAFGEGFLRYWIYDNPNYKLHQFNFEKNVPDTLAAAKLVNAAEPEFKGFSAARRQNYFLSWLGRQRVSSDSHDQLFRANAAHDGKAKRQKYSRDYF